MSVKSAVLDRYSKGAKEIQPALCCPVDYDQDLLERLPQEIIHKDYGCGNPSQYIKEGDVVLDLGSGGGKISELCHQAVIIPSSNTQHIQEMQELEQQIQMIFHLKVLEM